MVKMEAKTLWCSLLVGASCLLVRAVSANLKSGGRLYLNDYITAIEDVSSDPASFMVTTADSNYAIYSPRFHKIGWLSVTVNEELVFIVTNSNSTLTRRLDELDEDERDLIAEIRANFLQNLTGLKLSRAVASDSLRLLSNKLAYANSKFYASSGEKDNLKLSLAEQAIHLIDSVNQLDLRDKDDGGNEPQKEVKPQKGAQSGRSLSLAARQLRGQKARSFQYQARQKSYGTLDEGYRPSTGPGFCSRKSPAQFSYYNLLGFNSKESLCGDVYNFDLRCNILDVYSSSVSIKQTVGLSALYRDENFFAYSQSDLPRHINRFFLINDKVFFVYHDRSLLLKHDWLLDPLELEVVVKTRRQLRARPVGRASEAQTSDDDDDRNDDDARQDEQQEKGSQQVTGNEQPGGSAASDQRALANGGRKQ